MGSIAAALVTGATAGIGNAFAATWQRGATLSSSSRATPEQLEQVAAELRSTYGVDVEVLPADLSIREDVMTVATRLEDTARPIDTLVNNAGFGVHAKLLDDAADLQERAFDVMCLAVLILSGAAGRAMVSAGRAIISVTPRRAGSSGQLLRDQGAGDHLHRGVGHRAQRHRRDRHGAVPRLGAHRVRPAGITNKNLQDFVWSGRRPARQRVPRRRGQGQGHPRSRPGAGRPRSSSARL